MHDAVQPAVLYHTWLYSRENSRYCPVLAATASTRSRKLFTAWPLTLSTCGEESKEERKKGKQARDQASRVRAGPRLMAPWIGQGAAEVGEAPVLAPSCSRQAPHCVHTPGSHA